MADDRIPWLALRVIREKDGHSLTSLAKTADIALSYLSELESGSREPNARMTKKLAVALNVPVSVIEKRRRISDESGDAPHSQAWSPSRPRSKS